MHDVHQGTWCIALHMAHIACCAFLHVFIIYTAICNSLLTCAPCTMHMHISYMTWHAPCIPLVTQHRHTHINSLHHVWYNFFCITMHAHKHTRHHGRPCADCALLLLSIVLLSFYSFIMMCMHTWHILYNVATVAYGMHNIQHA